MLCGFFLLLSDCVFPHRSAWHWLWHYSVFSIQVRAHIAALQDVCSILVLTITRSSGVIRDQLVSLLPYHRLVLPTKSEYCALGAVTELSSHLHVIFESASFVISREKHNLAPRGLLLVFDRFHYYFPFIRSLFIN